MTTGQPSQPNVYRELLGKGSVYTFATAFQISSSLLVLPVVTRLLDAESFGEVALALVVMQIGGIAAGLGIPAAITRLHFDDQTGPRQSQALTWLAAVASILVALLLDLTGQRWSTVLGIEVYSNAFRLGVWAIPPLVVSRAAQSVLRARGEATRFVVVAGLLSLGANAAGLAAVLVDPSSSAFMVGIVLGTGAGGLAAVSMLGASISPRTQVSRLALAMGLPTVAHSLAIYAMSAGDRLVIQALSGLEEVGRYQPAYLAGSLGISLLIGLNNAWAPLIHGEEESRRWGVLASTGATVVKIGAVIAVCLAMAAPIALRVLVPPSYEPDRLADVAALVAASCIPYAAYLAAVHVLFQEKRTLALALLTPLAAATNIGLNFVLVRRIGLNGAALATVISYVVLAILVHVQARRVARVGWEWTAPVFWAGLATVGIVAGVTLPMTAVWVGGRLVVGLAAGAYLLVMARRLVVGADRGHGVTPQSEE